MGDLTEGVDIICECGGRLIGKEGDRASLIYGEIPLAEPWPYGDPIFHEDCCLLREGPNYCDCKASDVSDSEWGRGV